MIWSYIVLLALLIPLLAIILDSKVGQAVADRISGAPEEEGQRRERLESLESEVRYLSESLEALREETEFLRALLEGRTEGEEGKRLGPGD